MAIYHMKMTGQELESKLEPDKSLSEEGKAAEAKEVGERFKTLPEPYKTAIDKLIDDKLGVIENGTY